MAEAARCAMTAAALASWLAANPEPDGYAAALRHGGWSRVPPGHWPRHHRALRRWRRQHTRRFMRYLATAALGAIGIGVDSPRPGGP